jgi:hypothetical protein
MTVPFLQVSRDAAQALTEFSDEFRTALQLGDFDLWAAQHGLVRSTDALRTIFPIPLSAAGYHEFKGDMKYRSLYQRSLSMKSKTWQDGVEEFARVIEAPDFIDWAGQPGEMAREWLRLPNVIVMAMLEANPLLDFYRDSDSNTASTRALFAADHPFNVLQPALGNFTNDLTTTHADIASGKFFKDISLHYRNIKGPNGKPLGLRMSGGTFLVNPSNEIEFKEALEQDMLIRAVDNAGKIDATANVVAAAARNNIYKGTMGYTVTDESSQVDWLYAIAAGKPGLHPWVVQQGQVEEIVQDKSDAKYKDTLKVSISEVGQVNAAAALPHRITRIHITG